MNLVAYPRAAQSFTDRVFDLLDRVDYRQAVTDGEKDAVYQLRYRAYLREGAIPPNFSQRLSDRFDDLDNTWIIGVFVDGRLSGSIRLSIASPTYRDMPATNVFPDFLERELDEGRTVIDPTRFVIDHEMARHYPELPYVTTRVGWMAGEYFSADAILATVRTEHQAFYKRTFGHELIADARDYPTLTKPLSLMRLNYLAMKERVHRRYPFFRSTQFERRALFGTAASEAAVCATGGEVAEAAEPAAQSALAG